jgi:HlyD family secretion protein
MNPPSSLPAAGFDWLQKVPFLPRLLPSKRAQLLAMVGVLSAGIAPFALFNSRSKQNVLSSSGQPPLTAPAAESPFLQEVLERGEVASSSNVEIRCLVQSKSALGTAIIQIVDEGAYVKEGDFLVKLDDSGIQADLVQQRIATNTSRAMLTEAKTDYEAAKLALDEYESGTYRQEEGIVMSERFVAQENVRRAEEYVRYSEKLAAKGYVTEVQLEADRFAVQKAKKELENSTTKLEVLHRYTKIKNINRLKANVETAEARLRARENSHQLDLERENNLQEQLENCVIKAPSAGQVVYANPPSGDPLIAEGKMVRERQILIRLPDPKRMQVLARINESRINKVKAGLKAKIRLDAFPRMELVGTVRSVTEYPLPAISTYSISKEYGAEIIIDGSPKGVRSGMTAQVAIEVQRRDIALQVPIQSVLERGKRFFCFVAGEEIEAREVSIGAANEQSVIIEKGLSAGEHVLLSPQSVEADIPLPDPSPESAKPPKSAGEKTAKNVKT